jgi:hypothetical protein
VETTILSKNNFTYTIRYYKSHNEEYEAEYNQILSTFRFLEEDTSPVYIKDWQSLIPEIKEVIAQTFSTDGSGVTIYKTEDITGDGQAEVLVETGLHGANTGLYALIMIMDGEPVIAQIKNEEGEILNNFTFILGGGISTGLAIELSSDENAIFQGRSERNFETGEYYMCNIDAYKWNPLTAMFEYNLDLSNQYKSLCDLPEMNN